MAERFDSINHHHRDFGSVGVPEIRFTVDIRDDDVQRVPRGEGLDDRFGFVTEMAARPRIDVNSNGFLHSLLSAACGRIVWWPGHRARSVHGEAPENQNAFHPERV